jgi:hypothetical protein
MNFGLCRDLNLENICVVWSNNHHGSTMGAEESMNLLFNYLCVEMLERRRVPSAASATIGRQYVQRAAGSEYVRV